MDYKTLFPVLEMGFLFLDIQLKPAICKGCSYWQEIYRGESVKFEADLEHIFNLAGV
jgi:hypothetical protein